jgi:3D (Asp-Asp-Asp) domain-containing protein
MRPFVQAVLLVLLGCAFLALGASAAAHLPKAVWIHTETGVRVVSTHRATVGSVLEEARVPVGPHDRVIPAPATALASGLSIEVRRAFPITLLADGGRRTLLTAASSVAEFIGAAGVRLGPRDRVYPSPEQPLWPGTVVRIVRIHTEILTRTERVAYASVVRRDGSLPRGMRRLAQPGRLGARVRRVAVTYADGAVIDRQELGAVLVRPPQERVMQIGTRRLFASRGEFAGKEIIHMEATAYAPWDGPGTDDITSIGLKAGHGVVAVDPIVIPLRTMLFIEGYGRAIAGDVGGAIKGHRIDLGFDNARAARQFGRRPVRVYILSTPPPRRR